MRHARRRWPLAAGAASLAVAVAAGALLLAVQRVGVAPRTLAPYILKRSSGHNRLITGTGEHAFALLVRLDRGDGQPQPEPTLTLGAHEGHAAPSAGGQREVAVGDGEELRRALAQAEPGDVITLLPGTFRIHGKVVAARGGTAGQPVTVRAPRLGDAIVEFEAEEGFKVSAPWLRFENLVVRGACSADSDCEHAFHVVGGAAHFAAVNNRVEDFNAQFKVNGERGEFPDEGLIEANTLRNSWPRRTANPVTPIDLVAASRWVVRANVISDFVKLDGDRVSYGAFFKGGGAGNVFERNVIWCERGLQGLPGQRVGLSLGGGGTGKRFCRDGKCITEQDHGVIRDNLVLACSDAGIYLNSAAGSKVLHNTLLDTAGIDVRYPTSSADIDGNLVDGALRARNGALLRDGDNLDTPVAYAYLGYHPVRALFADAAAFDLAWKDGAPPRRERAGADPAGEDLCGVRRGARPAYGAFEDFAACVAAPASATASSSAARSAARAARS